jgi:hypothetical protein
MKTAELLTQKGTEIDTTNKPYQYGLQAIAKYLYVSKSTISAWRKYGKLDGVMFHQSGRLIHASNEDLTEFLNTADKYKSLRNIKPLYWAPGEQKKILNDSLNDSIMEILKGQIKDLKKEVEVLDRQNDYWMNDSEYWRNRSLGNPEKENGSKKANPPKAGTLIQFYPKKK